ncbi:unnamed protein product [Paramecium octaurelia]|uniref:Uncharacterized protein n=1 Tax=Paramecium octaurelia TaxID=43137 RepID=A0A8S1S7X1_PAROT|nr:unnamed protein product [Paramecium octaurelia]
MSLDSSQKCDEETGLKSMSLEPLELDDTYQTPVDIRWGNFYPLFQKNNIPKIVIGPHWPFFICAYFLFFIASVFLIGWHFTSTSSQFIKWATFIVCVNQCWSYAWVALINSGVINYDKNNSIENDQKHHHNQIFRMIARLGFVVHVNSYNFMALCIVVIAMYAFRKWIIIAHGQGNVLEKETQNNFTIFWLVLQYL